jgi:2-hydroxychromene-2-carboxylate isomerase
LYGRLAFIQVTRLEFWFDYSCPFAYLGSTQVGRLAQRMGAELSWHPMLLGGVFEASGTPQNLAGTLIPAKAKHGAEDMQRWAEVFGVPLQVPNGHPLRTVEALRATLVTGCDPRVIHGLYRAYWAEGRPPSDAATLRDVLGAAGHDADAVLARIHAQEVKDELRKRTEEAVSLGIFGAPSYVVERGPGGPKTLYWGQDRMHFVAGLSEAEVLPPLPSPATKRPHTLELYWDFSSPFAYLGSAQAEALAVRTGATLVWRPMLLGGLFKTVGQPMVPLQTWSAAKQRYYFEDMHRWAAHWQVAFKFPSRFPTNSLKAMRCYLALPEGRQAGFRERAFRATWAEDRDLTDDAVLRELVGDDGLEVLARAQTPVVKQALIEATQRAADAGVFGAPTWVVDGRELFWGQDRLPLVERALVR